MVSAYAYLLECLNGLGVHALLLCLFFSGTCGRIGERVLHAHDSITHRVCAELNILSLAVADSAVSGVGACTLKYVIHYVT